MNKTEDKFINFLSYRLAFEILIRLRFLYLFNKSFDIFKYLIVISIVPIVLIIDLARLSVGVSSLNFVL